MRQNLHAVEAEERANLVMLKACGRALFVLARSINKQLEHGHALSVREAVEIREIAIDMMSDAAEILAAPSLVESESGGVDHVGRDHLLVRLLGALERILDTPESARDFSASLESAANLIRSTCQDDDRPQRVRHAVRKAMLA